MRWPIKGSIEQRRLWYCCQLLTSAKKILYCWSNYLLRWRIKVSIEHRSAWYCCQFCRLKVISDLLRWPVKVSIEKRRPWYCCQIWSLKATISCADQSKWASSTGAPDTVVNFEVYKQRSLALANQKWPRPTWTHPTETLVMSGKNPNLFQLFGEKFNSV